MTISDELTNLRASPTLCYNVMYKLQMASTQFSASQIMTQERFKGRLVGVSAARPSVMSSPRVRQLSAQLRIAIEGRIDHLSHPVELSRAGGRLPGRGPARPRARESGATGTGTSVWRRRRIHHSEEWPWARLVRRFARWSKPCLVPVGSQPGGGGPTHACSCLSHAIAAARTHSQTHEHHLYRDIGRVVGYY